MNQHRHIYVNAECRFFLPALPSLPLREELSKRPGVQVWKKDPVVRAPYSAMGVITHLLRRHHPDPERIKVAHTCMGPREFKLPEFVPDGFWEGGGDLQSNPTGIVCTDYQRKGTRKLFKLGGGLIEAPPGSGKTVVGDLAALASGVQGKRLLLTVCKASARRQQAEEKARFYGVDPFIIMPKQLRRKSDAWHNLDAYMKAHARGDLAHGFGWIVAAWGALTPMLPTLLELGFDAVVLDEAHYAKSTDRVKFNVYIDEDDTEKFDKTERSNRSMSTYKLCTQIPNRYLTTATPLTNRLVDWQALGNLVEQPAFGDRMAFEAWSATPSRFLMHHCNGTSGEWGGIITLPPHHSHVPEFLERIKHTRYVVPYQALLDQLPPLRSRTHVVDVASQDKALSRSREDRAAYRQALKEAVATDLQGAASALSDARKERLTIIRLEDACNRKRSATAQVVEEFTSAASTRPADIEKRRADPRIPRGKGLVFYGLIRAVEDVARKIRRKTETVWIATGQGCVLLGSKSDGSEDVTTDVDTMKADYMAHPGPAVIVGSYQFLGESHNLQDSDFTIIGMLPYTPHMVSQIRGRGARLGMTRPLSYVYMVAEGTADERLKSILLDKMPALESLGEGAHGLDGFSDTLKGIDDLDGLLSGFVDAILAAHDENS